MVQQGRFEVSCILNFRFVSPPLDFCFQLLPLMKIKLITSAGD